MDRISLDAVNLALYVLPGAIFLYVRSQIGRGYRPEWSGILDFCNSILHGFSIPVVSNG